MRQLLARPLVECLLTGDDVTLFETLSLGEACWFSVFGDAMKAELRRVADDDKAEAIGSVAA